MRAVEAVLTEIGADELPVELVLNKIDAVDPLARRRLANRFPAALQISALTGEGLDELRERIAERFADRFEDVRLLVPYDGGREARRAVRARRADRRARATPRRASASARACRAASCRASRRTSSPRRSLPRSGSAVIELPVARLREDAVLPSRAYAGDAGLDLTRVRARRARARRARARRNRARRRDPGGLRGLRPAALGPRGAARDRRW